nr:hypothetical protein [Tanacetum cinerariifolium]
MSWKEGVFKSVTGQQEFSDTLATVYVHGLQEDSQVVPRSIAVTIERVLIVLFKEVLMLFIYVGSMKDNLLVLYGVDEDLQNLAKDWRHSPRVRAFDGVNDWMRCLENMVLFYGNHDGSVTELDF